jgi:hypothetical protein
MVDRLAPLVVGSYDDIRTKVEYVIPLYQRRWRTVFLRRGGTVVSTGCEIAPLERALDGAWLEGCVLQAPCSYLSAASWPDSLIERVPLVEIRKTPHDVQGLRDVF